MATNNQAVQLLLGCLEIASANAFILSLLI